MDPNESLGNKPKPEAGEVVTESTKRPTPASVLLVTLGVVLGLIVMSMVFASLTLRSTDRQPEPLVCTTEVKQCSDGSYVGRTAPNCEFEECSSVDLVIDGNEERDENSTDDVAGDTDKSGVVYDKRAYWGPCPSPDPTACRDLVTIYADGTLAANGVTTTVSVGKIEELAATISESGIMNKSCEASVFVDYSATYKVNEKEIRFPGCEEELKEIDEFVELLKD